MDNSVERRLQMVSLRADAKIETGSVIAYSPAEIVRRDFETGPGPEVETVQVTRRTSLNIASEVRAISSLRQSLGTERTEKLCLRVCLRRTDVSLRIG